MTAKRRRSDDGPFVPRPKRMPVLRWFESELRCAAAIEARISNVGAYCGDGDWTRLVASVVITLPDPHGLPGVSTLYVVERWKDGQGENDIRAIGRFEQFFEAVLAAYDVAGAADELAASSRWNVSEHAKSAETPSFAERPTHAEAATAHDRAVQDHFEGDDDWQSKVDAANRDLARSKGGES